MARTEAQVQWNKRGSLKPAGKPGLTAARSRWEAEEQERLQDEQARLKQEFLERQQARRAA